MKLNKFTIGAVAGIAAIAIAVPLFAQLSNAATAGTTNGSASSFTRSIPTQQQVTDMAAKDAAFLKNIDAFVTVEKSATQAHETALTAAAAITDDTQRQAAVQKANTDERTAIQNAVTANPDLKSAMMSDHGFDGRGGPGMGPNFSDLATKLGMSEADLKTALAGGKTIQQIATEKGVTLPTPPMGGFGLGKDSDMLAQKLGLTADQLKTELASGKTIQQLAQEHGVTLPAHTGGRGGWFGHGPATDASASQTSSTK